MTEKKIDDYQQKITDFINEMVEKQLLKKITDFINEMVDERLLNSIGSFKYFVNEIKRVCLNTNSGMTQDQLIEIIKEVQEILKYIEIWYD